MRCIYKYTVIIVYPRSNHIVTAVWAADKMDFVKKYSGIKKKKLLLTALLCEAHET